MKKYRCDNCGEILHGVTDDVNQRIAEVETERDYVYSKAKNYQSRIAELEANGEHWEELYTDMKTRLEWRDK